VPVPVVYHVLLVLGTFTATQSANWGNALSPIGQGHDLKGWEVWMEMSKQSSPLRLLLMAQS
jgi:hypothetical protein